MHATPIRLRHMALYKCVFDRLINKHNNNSDYTEFL